MNDDAMTLAESVLAENSKRLEAISAPYDPVTGEGSVGERVLVRLSDYPLPKQWLPKAMMETPLVKRLASAGSVKAFIAQEWEGEDDADGSIRAKVVEQLVRLRCLHDFPFWCACFVKVKNKGGGPDVLLRLSRPQRMFVEAMERMRLAGKPIRIVLLKARQWGGSTTSQMYMAWLQLVHKVGLNSLIIAHQGSGSDEIKDMFDRMIKDYPAELLAPPGVSFDPSAPKIEGVGHSGAIQRVPLRNCKIKIGTAERPDSCRGGDYNLVHLSEVGVWKKTDGKSPEEIVASACTGVMLKPYTMIVYESTAKGSDNFFHKEYVAAKSGKSQFESLFIPWHAIEWNSLPFASDADRRAFAKSLVAGRYAEEAESPRQEPGKYLWWLWQKGATLEAISWYVRERAGKSSHDIMAAECPTDDIEAFVYSGANVFDRYLVEEMRPMCHPPRHLGEVCGDAADGELSLRGLRFCPERYGRLKVWSLPEEEDGCRIANRYLVVVDVGVGRTSKADNSVIAVFDRFGLADRLRPSVVAEWVGHIDKDLLAWKAAQIAKYYDNALLVIESNSLETRAGLDSGTDHSSYILSLVKEAYPNLYARRQSPDDIRAGIPAKYGFHTNASTTTVIIDGLVRAVREKEYVERSEDCLAELLTYVRTPRGSYEASPGHHDDRLMTRAIGLYVSAFEMDAPRIVQKERPARKRPSGSMSQF